MWGSVIVRFQILLNNQMRKWPTCLGCSFNHACSLLKIFWSYYCMLLGVQTIEVSTLFGIIIRLIVMIARIEISGPTSLWCILWISKITQWWMPNIKWHVISWRCDSWSSSFTWLWHLFWEVLVLWFSCHCIEFNCNNVFPYLAYVFPLLKCFLLGLSFYIN